MTERERGSDSHLSTDFGQHEAGPRIGSVPGQAAEVDISGFPGGGTGWGAWPAGMGTSEETAESASAASADDDADTDTPREQIGARHGQLADSGVNTGPVST